MVRITEFLNNYWYNEGMKEELKKKFNIEKDLQKELKEIEKIIASREDNAVKLESIKAILNELAQEIVEARIDRMFEERTGFLGPKFAEAFLTKEIESAKRYKKPFSLAILDIDFLKYINDNFGHILGTKAILEMTKVIKKNVRRSDIISRYGGDEFLIIFPQTPKEKAGLVIERIKKDVSKLKVEGKIRVSLSVGLEEYPVERNLSTEAFLGLVDDLLYRAKEDRVNVNLTS